MTLLRAFEVGLLVVGAAVVTMAVAIVGTKGVRALRAHRRARLVAEVRPAVLAALDDDRTVLELTRRRNRVAADIATSLLPKLRGRDREALARLLVEHGIIPAAVDGLRSRSAARRHRAAELLGNAGYAPAERDVARLLHDRDADVRAAAARALGKIGRASSAVELFEALGERRVPANTASMAILRIGPVGAGPLAAALDSTSPTVRSVAAELAGSLGLMDVRVAVESLLGDAESIVRVSAARALGRLSMPASAAALITHLESELRCAHDPQNEEFLIAIVGAVGRIGHRSAIPALESALMRRHRLSGAVAGALVGMGVRRSLRSTAQRATDAAECGTLAVATDGVASGQVTRAIGEGQEAR